MEFLGVSLLAFLGGYIFKKLRIPAGQMLGAVVVTALLNVFLMEVTYTPEVKFVSRILAGILIGLRIKREDVRNLKGVYRPLCVLITCMLSYTVGLAFLFSTSADMDLKTALFACVPGGLTDISLMAEDYGANMPQVALVQTVRLLSIMLVFPWICLSVAKKTGKDTATINRKGSSNSKKSYFYATEAEAAEAVRTFVYAGLGGYFLGAIHVPAGEMLGAMAVTLYLKLGKNRGHFYPPMREVVQVIVGIVVGSGINQQTVDSLFQIFPIALVLAVCVLLFAIIMGWVLHRFFQVDFVTALLSCAPGGVQEMILITDSLGGDVSFVTTLQMFRLVSVLTLFPIVIQIILALN